MISVSYFAVTKKKLPLKRKYLSYHTQHSATISSGLFNREITNFVVGNKLQYHKTFFLLITLFWDLPFQQMKKSQQ